MSSDSIPPLLGIANRDIDVLRVITDCLHEAVCVIDAEERVVVWNRSSEKLYAVEREQILHRRITDFFPDSLIARVGRSRQASHNVHHSPRAGQHILASAEPLYMNGVFLGAVSSDRDYAEVTRLYQELEDAKSRVQFLEGEIQRFSGS
ncbi:MAG: PAS domain-containing protein, partial [Planctomycetota bacterium]|nr:PAS domain-containing protein [Planctomycetota bacterium]